MSSLAMDLVVYAKSCDGQTNRHCRTAHTALCIYVTR